MKLDRLTPDQIRMLAKVRCAEHISQRIKGPIPRRVSDLAYGRAKPVVLLGLQRAGYIGWDNGSILTAAGASALEAALGEVAP